MEIKGFTKAAEIAGVTSNALKRIVSNGKEIPFQKNGNFFVFKKEDIDKWKDNKTKRIVELSKEDFLKALKFALEMNYAGHTRTDFGKLRQRTFMQAVENWTQGILAELAFQKFMKDRFDIQLKLEFRIYENAIVGQDITEIKKGRIVRPPRKFISIKSGKGNGMFLIVPVREVEASERLSDYYIFIRVIFPVDIFARLYRDLPELKEIRDKIPDFESVKAEICGYCKREELDKGTLPELEINEERYYKATGLLKNTDQEWQIFADEI